MIFLQPAAFALLLGAAVIVILYLLRSPRQERQIPTSALWLRLKDVSKITDRRRRTIISLLLQLLIFLLLVAAAVRPYLIEEGDSRTQTIALVIDHSASMQIDDAVIDGTHDETTSRLDSAKAKAQQMINRMRKRGTSGENDRALIIQAGAQPRILQNVTDNTDDLKRAIQRIKPSSEVANFTKAARLLEQLARAWPDLKIYILSDGQLSEESRKAWKKVGLLEPGVGVTATPASKIRITYLPIGGRSPNVGIVNFAARRNLDAISDFEVVAEVENFGPEPVECLLELRMSTAKEEFDAKLKQDEKTGRELGVLMDVFALKLEPGERQKRILRKGNVPLEGIVKAALTKISGGNKLLLDDTAAQLVPRTRRAKTVLFADEKESFLLGVMRANIGIQAYRLPIDNYRPNLPVDAYIFVNHLPEKLPSKNVLLINSEGKVTLDGKGNAADPEIALLAGESMDEPKVRGWNKHHPVMNRVSFQNLLLGKAFKVTSRTGAETVARTESGPLVLTLERGKQKLIYIGFNPQDSDLVFRTAFPLIIDNCVRWFMQDESAAYEHMTRPGESKTISLESDAKNIQVFMDMEKPTIIPAVDGRATLDVVPETGIYLYRDAKRLRAFAVNLSSAQESDVSVKELLDIGEVNEEAPKGTAGIADRRLWPYLAFFIPFLLMIESYLYHRRIAF